MIKYTLLLLGFTGPKEFPKMIENEIEKLYHVEISEIRKVNPTEEIIESKRGRYKADKVLSYYKEDFKG